MGHDGGVIEDHERCYRAVQSRDERFDGWFVTAVHTTRIYCRPSCPARTPKAVNVSFFATAAGAQAAGFRACKRCRPDASPGSPEWRLRGDVVARAMRLIADGVVDREGVAGLARRLGYSPRQLQRRLVDDVGAGPLALARVQRARTARVLVETTDLPFADVAFSAGFSSVRQFNDTVREVFATTPSELRRRRHRHPAPPGAVSLRLAARRPFAIEPLLAFLGARCVAPVESFDGGTFRRSLRLHHGGGTVAITAQDGSVTAVLRLADNRDLPSAVERCRRLLDLDADPVAVDAALGADPLIGPLVAGAPGRRIPGCVDPEEQALRAVLGQQVSVGRASALAGLLATRLGAPLDVPDGDVTHRFPSAADVAGADDADLAVLAGPRVRRDTVRRVAAALAEGRIDLSAGADPNEAERALVQIPGVGPWTAAYVRLRALGDPDAFLASDLGVRRALEAMGRPAHPAAAAALAERWRPWRGYALMHLWSGAAGAGPASPAPRPGRVRRPGRATSAPHVRSPRSSR